MSIPMWPKKRAKLRALENALGRLDGLRCLHIGADDGRFAAGLQTTGGRWVHVTEPAAPLPFPDAAFEVVVLTDVLEAVPDDRALAREAIRCLAKAGRLIVTAPVPLSGGLAGAARRFGLTDADFGHVRPGYAVEGVRALIEGRGVVIDSVRTLGGALDELLELATNALLARRRRHAPGAPPALPTSHDWRGWRGRLARLLGGLVRLAALLDRLPGMHLAATTVICARKPLSPSAAQQQGVHG